MANYTRENIQHVAKLSHLEISEEEITAKVSEFNRLVGMFEKLNELETDDIQPSSHSTDSSETNGTPMEEDQNRPSVSPKEALANAPARQDDFFLVPRVIGEE